MKKFSRIVKLHGLTPMASTVSGFRQAESCTEGHSSMPLRAWPSGAWVKVLAPVVAILFMNSLLIVDSYAQVNVSPAGAAQTSPVKEDIGQPLAEAGNVTVNFKDVDIKTVLHYLSEVSGVDIIPSPGVEGLVTMRLRNKPWEVALDIVTRNYGYVYSREGDIIRVIPKGQLHAEEPVTEVIPLNHLIRDIELTKTEEGNEEVLVEQKEESINQLMTAINSILNPRQGEKATYISSVNSIVITAIPARISDIKTMISKIDKKTPQIILDAKVVEILLNEDERFGVDWNAVITAAGAKKPITFPFKNDGTLPFLNGAPDEKYYPSTGGRGFAPTFPWITDTGIPAVAQALAGTDLFTYGYLDFSTFTATLALIDQRGDSEILSSPRITTLNNQRATIKVIQKIMLQEALQSTDTSTTVTVQFEDMEDAREVGVKLVVIPHVNEEGDISVNLLPEVSNNEGFSVLTLAGAAQQGTVALTFNSREANTIIRVRDGDTIFLGGLIRKELVTEDNKLPILGDLLGGIPVLGSLFKYESEEIRRTEIVFFVTVHLVKDAMDSIADSETQPHFDKYITQKESAEETETAPVLMTGKLKTTQKQVEVPVGNTEAVQPKREYAPWLDFRKKK